MTNNELGFSKTDVRFFIYDDEIENSYDDTAGNFRESNETEFLDAEGVIEYERHSVHENGCRQICLTKNPIIS